MMDDAAYGKEKTCQASGCMDCHAVRRMGACVDIASVCGSGNENIRRNVESRVPNIEMRMYF